MLSHILSIGPLIVFCIAILAGSFTNGLAGLAFSAVSGGAVFMILPPASAVCVMASCGLLLQVCNNIHFFRHVDWRKIMEYAIPGIVGVPVGSRFLTILPRAAISLTFGVILLIYVAWTIFRKHKSTNDFGGRLGEWALGFIAGVASGMLALPGIPAIIWCNLRGYTKVQQRGISVPLNFLLLLVTIGVSGVKGDYRDPYTQAQLLFAIPVALIGWSVGVRCFGRISEVGFRRFISAVLACSGVALVAPSLHALFHQGRLRTQPAVVQANPIRTELIDRGR